MAGYTRDENLADARGAGRHAVDDLQLPEADDRAACRATAMPAASAWWRSATSLVAAEDMHFCLSEARLGLLPATISPYVVRAHGRAGGAPLFRHRRALRRRRGAAHRLRARGGAAERSMPRSPSSSPRSSPTGRGRREGLQAAGAGRRRPRDHAALRAETARRIADIRASDEGREGDPAFLDKRKPDWLAAATMRPDARPDTPAAGPGRRAGLGERHAPVRGGVPRRRRRLDRLDRPAARPAGAAAPGLLAPAACMLFVEFFADKIPGVDTVWDTHPHGDPHPGRRGAGGRRARRRRPGHGLDGRRCWAAAWPRPATPPS